MHTWVVEVRIKQDGRWTVWQPMDAWRTDHVSVPNAFHGKKLAEWECRECRKQSYPHKYVEYRVRRYDRRES